LRSPGFAVRNEPAKMDMVAFVEARSTPEPNTGCWLWLGAVGQRGYPKMRVAPSTTAVSRALMGLRPGRSGQDPIACHRCDNPICVNPGHIYVGTARTNALDMSNRGRHPQVRVVVCKNGHSKLPRTRCKQCVSANAAATRERIRANPARLAKRKAWVASWYQRQMSDPVLRERLRRRSREHQRRVRAGAR
jgi:hypothetical protein